MGHYAWQRQESGQQIAERLMDQGLRELGWDETELEWQRKGGDGNMKLACRLRAETTMTLAWIARRLKMGAGTYAANLIYATTRRTIKS